MRYVALLPRWVRELYCQTTYVSQMEDCCTCFLSITCILVFTYGKWLAVVRMVFLLYCSCSSPCARPPGVNGVAYTNLSVGEMIQFTLHFQGTAILSNESSLPNLLDEARSYSNNGTHYGTCQWTGTVKNINYNSEELIYLLNTDMRCLMMGIRSEKYVIRRFSHCTNVIECTYTNLDSIANYTPRLYLLLLLIRAQGICPRCTAAV